jgi:hypothetical protein
LLDDLQVLLLLPDQLPDEGKGSPVQEAAAQGNGGFVRDQRNQRFQGQLLVSACVP